MLIVRVIAAALKPALVGGVIATSAAGGVYAWEHTRNDGPTAFERLQSAGQRLIISEFGDTEDTIVGIDPGDVGGSRTEIARIDHAPGYGAFATLSPDGHAIAYTSLPSDVANPSPATPAIAAVVGTNGDVKTLADDVDLLIAPVWSPDGTTIVVRKNTPETDAAGSFELLLLGRDGSRSTITSWRSAAVFPIAFAPDGSKLYFATLNAAGSDLYAVAPDGADEAKIGHLGDEIARDWRLSPDGARLAYAVAGTGATPRVHTMTFDLATGLAAEAVSPDTGATQLNPAWRGDGRLSIASVDPHGGGDAVSVDAAGATERITDNDASIDLPLDWSPDGSTLAVRAIEGATPFEAGSGHLELVRDGSIRERVSDNPDVQIVGWLR